MSKLKSIVPLLLLIILIGCEQSISLDLPEYKSKIAVNCILQPDNNPILVITRSEERLGYVNDLDTIPLMPDAAITINSDAGLHACEYLLGFEGNTGFNCEMDIPHSGALSLRIEQGGDVVTAETSIPSKATVASAEMEIETETFYEYEYKTLFLNAKIQDVADEKNFYRLAYSFNYDPDDPLDTTPASEGSFYFSDSDNEGGEVLITENIQFFNSFENHDIVYVDVIVQSLSESAFNFFSTAEAQDNIGDLADLPFTEPIPINGNIENGLGVFGVVVNSDPLRISFMP